MVTVTSLKFQRYETKTDQKNIVPLTLELTWILNLAFLAVQKCFPVSSPRRMSFATKRGLDQAAQNLNYFNMWSKVVQYYKYVSRNNPRETRFGNGTQVKPCRSGLRTGWVTNREYRLKGPYVVLLFFFFLAYYVVLLLTVYWKADLALFRRPDLEKDKNKKTNMARSLWWKSRNTELKLCRLWSIYIGGDGFTTVNDHNASDSNLLSFLHKWLLQF